MGRSLIVFMTLAVFGASNAAVQQGLRGVFVYTYDPSFVGSDLFVQEVQPQVYEKVSKEFSQSKPLQSAYDFLNLLDGRCDIQLKCAKEQCEKAPAPSCPKAPPCPSCKACPICPAPQQCPTTPRPTQRALPTCANGAKNYPDCCLNGGFGKYCCANKANNPDCCLNPGGKGKFCCTNGANNAECSLPTTPQPTTTTKSKPKVGNTRPTETTTTSPNTYLPPLEEEETTTKKQKKVGSPRSTTTEAPTTIAAPETTTSKKKVGNVGPQGIRGPPPTTKAPVTTTKAPETTKSKKKVGNVGPSSTTTRAPVTTTPAPQTTKSKKKVGAPGPSTKGPAYLPVSHNPTTREPWTGTYPSRAPYTGSSTPGAQLIYSSSSVKYARGSTPTYSPTSSYSRRQTSPNTRTITTTPKYARLEEVENGLNYEISRK